LHVPSVGGGCDKWQAGTVQDTALARRAFVASQAAALGPFDYVVVATLQSPLDAIRVRREEDGSLAVEVGLRDASNAFSEEQVAALSALGFRPGTESWVGAGPCRDAGEAADVVERVLVEVLGAPEGGPVDIRHGSEREEREARAKLEELRTSIEPVLAGIVGDAPSQDADGDYVLDIGKTRVFVAPRVLPARPPIIRVFAITNAGLNLRPDLGLFLARLNFSLMFGRFSIDAEHQAVWFDETLLGDHVTDEELRFTVEMVAATAGEWDQKIAQMFGGVVRQPPSPEAPPLNKPGQGGYL
jgi:hypothetical protein